MKSIWSLLKRMAEEAEKDGIFRLANEMTYKGILSLFPFIIFLMNVLGLLDIDFALLLNAAKPVLAPQIFSMLNYFLVEVAGRSTKTLLSVSLIVAVFSASSGLRAIMRGINQSYGLNDTRSFPHRFLLSILLVLIFTAAVVSSLLVLIFGSTLHEWLEAKIPADPFMWDVAGTLFTFAVLMIVLLSVTLTYKLALNARIHFVRLMPGAAVSVLLWLAASKIFNVYIENFSSYSKLYGAIGSLFILLLWLNMTGVILLLGSELNALLDEDYVNKIIETNESK